MTGAILVAGVVLALSGVLIHLLGAELVNKALPPVVNGAVVLLIGSTLAPWWPRCTGRRTSGSPS